MHDRKEIKYDVKDASQLLKRKKISLSEIVSILNQHPSNIKLVTVSLFYMWQHTTRYSSDPEEEVYISSAIESTLSVMRRHPLKHEIQDAGCGIFLNFSAKSGPGYLCNSANKIVESIVRAMRLHLKNISLQARGCGALMNMAVNPVFVSLISSCGAIDVIVDSMRSNKNKEKVQNRACGALQNLATIAGNCELIYNIGGVELIVIAMKKHEKSEELNLHAIGAIRNLSNYGDALDQLRDLNAKIQIEKAKKKFISIQQNSVTEKTLEKLS